MENQIEKEKFPTKMKITKSQFSAIIEAANVLSSLIGGGSNFDEDTKNTVKAIDRFIKANGYKRKYN